MRCEQAQQRILEQPDPDAGLDAEVQQHLDDCQGCRTVQDDLGRIRGALGAAPLPGLPAGFELSLNRKLAAVAPAAGAGTEESAAPGQGRARSRRLVGLLAAAALLLAVVGVVLLARQRGPALPPLTHHRLTFTVHSDRAFPAAIFDVTLPEGVRLSPEAGDALLQGTGLRWRSALLPGHNRLHLPLESLGGGQAVVARLTAGGRTVQARVSLDAGQQRGSLQQAGVRVARLELNLGQDAATRGRP